MNELRPLFSFEQHKKKSLPFILNETEASIAKWKIKSITITYCSHTQCPLQNWKRGYVERSPSMTNIKVKEEPAETLKTQTCVREPNPAFPCLCGLHTACSMMLLTLTKTNCSTQAAFYWAVLKFLFCSYQRELTDAFVLHHLIINLTRFKRFRQNKAAPSPQEGAALLAQTD